MIWAAVYVCIGLLIGDSSQVKGGGRPGLAAYIICAIVWPLIIGIAFIEEIDRIKRGRGH
jgi:membrane protein DedA with SNARE-associated domain